MKRLFLSVLTGMIVLFSSGGAVAADYGPNIPATYTYNIGNLDNLDHYYAYAWGVVLPDEIRFGKEKIVAAGLYFDNIQNNDNLWNVMHVSLINKVDAATALAVGITKKSDSNLSYKPTDIGISNYFQNAGDLLFRWEDLNDVKRDVNITITDDKYIATKNNTNYEYPLNYNSDLMDGIGDGAKLFLPEDRISLMNIYAQNNIFGLGFDPDCHFYNNGITLKLWTETKTDHTPEPATLMLFGAGLLGLAAKMRKKSQVNG